jgi:hypothetical protein
MHFNTGSIPLGRDKIPYIWSFMNMWRTAIPWIWALLLQLQTNRIEAQSTGPVDWEYDIHLMGKELAERHCNLFFHSDSTTFIHRLDLVSARADHETFFGNAVKLQQVVATLGDENTRINYHYLVDPEQMIPLQLYWFEDGVYVLGSLHRHRAILGKKIRAINGVPLEQIADSMATLLPANQPGMLREEFPHMVTWMQLLDHFGIVSDNRCTIEYELEEGKPGWLNLSLPEEEEMVEEVGPENIPLAWRDRKSYFREQYLSDERLYYIQYNKCWSREVEEVHGSGASALFMPSYDEFEKKVMQTLRRNPVDKIVLDLRFNDGGEPGQGSRFIEKLSKVKMKGAGRFYLIIGRKTRGAALQNAIECITTTGAIVVGEPSGGKPNHFGGVKRFVLPETNLIVNYSTRYIPLIENDPPSLLPDFDTPLAFKQYLSGFDPPLEAILREPL